MTKLERWYISDSTRQDGDSVLIIARWHHLIHISALGGDSKHTELYYFKEWDVSVRDVCQELGMDGFEYHETFCEEGWGRVENGRVEMHTLGMTTDGTVVTLANKIEDVV